MDVMTLVISIAACSSYPAYICDAQAKTGIDPQILYAVCLVESQGTTTAFHPHDGHGSSLGVCQVKLSTAQLMGFKGSEKDLMDPTTNAVYAAKYLSKHLVRYKDLNKALSAYNAGHAIQSNYAYVGNVLKQYNYLKESR